MNQLDKALKLANTGFHVFPIAPGCKAPPILKDWETKASNDPETVERWWTKYPDANIGIATSKFKDDKSLIVVDIDVKNGKSGYDTLSDLEIDGVSFPLTYSVKTPSGGEHLYYEAFSPVQSGTDKLGSGVDIKSSGGYVVAEGSITEDGEYTGNEEDIKAVSASVATRLPKVRKSRAAIPLAPDFDTKALESARLWIQNQKPSIQGEGGDEWAFKVVAKLKDRGVPQGEAYSLLWEDWNPRCEPPWSAEELRTKVLNAYKYGQNEIGCDSVDTAFAPVQGNDKMDSEEAGRLLGQMNKVIAHVISGGTHHILWERVDQYGKMFTDHVKVEAFHSHFANQLVPRETRNGISYRSISKIWMEHPSRRSYMGLCFNPGIPVPAGYFNLWRGFAEVPAEDGEELSPEAHQALKEYKTHMFENICARNQDIFMWTMGWLAHMIQKPFEKPRTALVLRGGKGTGKNAFVEPIMELLGRHGFVVSDRRYITGQFNAHLEQSLMVGLDEAFWSGDKAAEGRLKDLITGVEHVIERKNMEVYKVRNLTRILVLGNEDWLVPASEHERRYTVLQVGIGKRQNDDYFNAIKRGMDLGGRRLLLRFLMDFDLSKVNINVAPKTNALLDQISESLSPQHQWWYDSLIEGEVVGMTGTQGEWTHTRDLVKEDVRQAFRAYCNSRNIKGRMPNMHRFGIDLVKICRSVVSKQKMFNGVRVTVYVMPNLETCRSDWEHFLGHKINWEDLNREV